MELSVSILSSNNRIDCIKKLNQTNIDYFHLDVMDGIFVNNFQMPKEEINELSKYTEKPLDIHLMVENPEEYIDSINLKNISYITFHLEIEKDIKSIIDKIRKNNIKVGLSIKPNTIIERLIPYLDYIDLILIMSVEPGKGGQKFLDTSLDKIKKLKEYLEKNNYDIKIEVDGGINDTNIQKLKDHKTDIVVSGSYIINSDNYQNQINKIKIWFFLLYVHL